MKTTEKRKLKEQKARFIQEVKGSKTLFEYQAHLENLKDVCASPGEPLPNEQELGVPVKRTLAN